MVFSSTSNTYRKISVRRGTATSSSTRSGTTSLAALRDATQRLVDLANQLEGHFNGSATLSEDVLSQLLSDVLVTLKVFGVRLPGERHRGQISTRLINLRRLIRSHVVGAAPA